MKKESIKECCREHIEKTDGKKLENGTFEYICPKCQKKTFVTK